MLRRLLAAALLVLLVAACGAEDAADDIAVESEAASPTTAPTAAPSETGAAAADVPAPPIDEPTSEEPAAPPAAPPAETPVATEDPAPPAERQVFELSLNGDGTEGGCTWGVDADEVVYDVVYPEGYEIVGNPVTLVGPDGDVIAGEGGGMRVTGRVAPEREPSCVTGTVLLADHVEPL